ncbi:MAG: hypothetical protein ACHQ4H_10810, partial [Ktedonobacterales bacterium]
MAQESRTTGHDPSAAQSLLERARRVLGHEQRMGHADSAVKPGGLEAFITRWAEEVREARVRGAIAVEQGRASGPPPEEAIVRLFAGYHTLDPMSRAAKVRAALALLDAIKAKPQARPPGPARPAAPKVPPRDPPRFGAGAAPAPATARIALEEWPLAVPVPLPPVLGPRRDDIPRPKPRAEDAFLLDAPVTAVSGVGPTQA